MSIETKPYEFAQHVETEEDIKAYLTAFLEEMDSEGHVEVVLPGGLRLAWDSLDVIMSFNDAWETAVGHRMGIAFLCDSPDEVDKLYEAVVAAGYESHKEPWDAFWGQRYAQVKDPDGNIIDLFASLA
ncbi:MAG: VOC family protein [Chloroflexota bacterium]